MIQVLGKGKTFLTQVELEEVRKDTSILDDALWVDLLHPTPDEEEFVEHYLKIEIPSKAEMHEIEESSRLFVEDDALFMSCWLLSFESPIPENTSVTFVLKPEHCLSIRYSDHHPFRLFSSPRKRVQPRKLRTTDDVFVELLDAIVGSLASTLRQVEQSLNSLSLEIFAEKEARRRPSKYSKGLKAVVQRLGKRNSLVSSLRESSLSFQNITPFFVANANSWILPEQSARLRTIERDIRSLREYDAQLSSEINFLLDSTVGLINIEQNQSMKILSVAALLLAFI